MRTGRSRTRRNEVTRQERRLQQREESLDKKSENMEKKEEQLAGKLREAENRLAEAEEVKKQQFELLEKISGYTADQAKEYLLQNLENELTHEKAVRISQMEARLKDEADPRRLGRSSRARSSAALRTMYPK